MNTVMTTEFDPHTDHIWGYRSGLGYIFIYIHLIDRTETQDKQNKNVICI